MPSSSNTTTEPAKGKAAFRATAAQLDEIERIKQVQESLKLSDVAFCRDCLVHSATWGQLKRHVYTGKVSTILDRMTAHAGLVQELHERKNTDRSLRLHAGAGFVPFREYEALERAAKNVLAAADQGSEDKCIWVVGSTGAGKDACGNHLMTKGLASWKFTARPSWRLRYMPALVSIAEGLGIARKLRGVAAAERAIIDYLRTHKGMLLFTEVELLCKETLDFFRSILNETDCGIIILITPEYYERLRDRGDTGTAQLMRRTVLVIHLKPVDGGRVLTLLQQRWEDSAALKQGAEELAAEAAQFGQMDFVQRVIGSMARKLAGSTTQPTLELIREEIRIARRFVPRATIKHGRAA